MYFRFTFVCRISLMLLQEWFGWQWVTSGHFCGKYISHFFICQCNHTSSLLWEYFLLAASLRVIGSFLISVNGSPLKGNKSPSRIWTSTPQTQWLGCSKHLSLQQWLLSGKEVSAGLLLSFLALEYPL